MGNKGAKVAVATLLITAVAAGCQAWDGSSDPIDPPQAISTKKEKTTTSTAIKTEQPLQSTLYFKDRNGYVAPVVVRTETTDTPAKAVLAAMVEGATTPSGFTGLLPKGTEVKGINIVKDEKLAVVDFSKPFLSYKKEDERKMLEAVTWALTSFPTIDKVQLRVEGKLLEQMPAMGTPLDQPLSRKMGINVESVNGVTWSQAMPVTLYFQAKGKDKETYLVPVTRMIAQTEKPLEAAMKQLSVKPKSKGLVPVISSDVQLVSMQLQNQVVTVNLKDELLKKAAVMEEESLRAVIMSLLDNSAATHVQVMVNDHAVEDKPVSRLQAMDAFEQ